MCDGGQKVFSYFSFLGKSQNLQRDGMNFLPDRVIWLNLQIVQIYSVKEAYKYLKAWRSLVGWLEDKYLKARRLLAGWLDRWVPGCHTPHSAVAFPHTHSQNWARHKSQGSSVHNIRHQRVKDKDKTRALCKEALLAPRINHGWGCGKMPESVRNEKCKVQNGASTFITITKFCLNVHCN